MAIDFEEALAGEHGEIARKAAEDAVSSAVKQLGQMLNPAGLRALPEGVERFASGGVFNPPKARMLGFGH